MSDKDKKKIIIDMETMKEIAKQVDEHNDAVDAHVTSLQMLAIAIKTLPWYSLIALLPFAIPLVFFGVTLMTIGEILDRSGWSLIEWFLPTVYVKTDPEK